MGCSNRYEFQAAFDTWFTGTEVSVMDLPPFCNPPASWWARRGAPVWESMGLDPIDGSRDAYALCIMMDTLELASMRHTAALLKDTLVTWSFNQMFDEESPPYNLD